MTRLVVDADILGILQRAEGLASIAALTAPPWVITDEIWYEVTDNAAASGAYPSSVEEMREFLAAIAGSPTVIEPMSPEAAALAKLSAPPVKEDPGELSVIAYAYHHPDTIAVLHDRAAVFRGIEELRGRVISIHGLLGLLRADHGLAATDTQRISDHYCKRHAPIRSPLWW
ncbi:MAG TPA: hypothetical protein VFK02_02905 [Kofleriaceae bacterium]|nr:hypothetical protein [Kofleriaceae bacterium]